MREKIHARHQASAALAVAMVILTLPAPGAARAAGTHDLPECSTLPAGRDAAAEAAPRWRALLDEAGVLTGHELSLDTADGPVTLSLGPRAFASDPLAGRFVLGERRDGRTDVAVVDTARGCRAWSGSLEGEAYDVRLEGSGRSLRFVSVDPRGRAYRGTFRMRLDGAAEGETIAEPCLAVCEATDDGLGTAIVPTLTDPQPVPFYPGSRWAQETALTFRWQQGDEPPTWARPAIRAAAEGANATRRSRAPTFTFDSAASDGIRYTATFPHTCRYGIACATRNLPLWWTVRLRPHGTDFSWGTLRWCQRDDTSGCFDIERTMLHELGHVIGLGHPDDAGFLLGASQTVMHSIIPARPKAGSGMHAFGPCDVASLQRAYDVPNPSTLISACLDLETRLTLRASEDRVTRGSSVRLRATLSVTERDAYGLLSGDPLRGRSVLLRYRAAGSSDAWTTVWMEDGDTAGAYAVTLAPGRDLEFQAVFRAPDGEGLRASTSRVVTVTVAAP